MDAEQLVQQELEGEVTYILGYYPNDARADGSDPGGVVIAKLRGGQIVKGEVSHEDHLKKHLNYKFLGYWVQHPRHGDQFSFDTVLLGEHKNIQGVMYFLQKEIEGVGPAKARKLWELYGPDTLDVMKDKPDEIAAMGLLTAADAKAASEKIAAMSEDQETKIELFGLFAKRGFPRKAIPACIRKWKSKAPAIIRRNPYLMMSEKIPGAGFKRCDKLYTDLGHNPAKLKRQALCAWYQLFSDRFGHTWFGVESVRAEVLRTIGTGEEVTPYKAIKLGLRAGLFRKYKDAKGELWISQAKRGINEEKIAGHVLRLLDNPFVQWPSDPIPQLTDHQQQIKDYITGFPLAILAGTPGVGKSVSAALIISQIVDIYGADEVRIAAPTGKAAVRLTEILKQHGIREIEATTIHRLLEVSRNGHDGDGWGFERNEHNPLECKFVITDEMSMADTDLAASLFAACPPGCHVLLIGDPYQLPPVGHGAPLRDLIAAGVPCGELTEIRRNSGLIVQACRQIKDRKEFEYIDGVQEMSKGLELAEMNLQFRVTDSPEMTLEKLQNILQFAAQQELFDPVWDCQVLCGVNTKGELNRVRINRCLQSILNTNGEQCERNPFRVDDKIICLTNNVYPEGEWQAQVAPSGREVGKIKQLNSDGVFIANGEIGKVVRVQPGVSLAEFNAPQRTVVIYHSKKETADQGQDDYDGINDQDDGKVAAKNFDLAYAVTGHKMQGSEAPVIIVLADSYGGATHVCSKEWWYTALSRARKLCIIVGEKKALEKQIRRESLVRRKTFLKERLQACLEEEKKKNQKNPSGSPA